jgi:poly-gamma-glutamate synthesis protein (capsule biosynthesis protein)
MKKLSIFLAILLATLTYKEPPPPEKHILTFIGAGDNLFHMGIINNAYENGRHNFDPIYSEIKSLIQGADVAFINQETVMAGTRFGYSGFPLFNSPQSLARTLADTGFTVVNIANNHTMDMGRSGLHATLDLFDTMPEITVIGARKSEESHRIITKNNITIGFLSYTCSLNGAVLPADEPNLVSIIDRRKMSEEINALRSLCDFLLVSMHWGEEYRLIEPDSFQKNLAVFLAEHNVDVIIGHHPHVLQRVERLPRPDGKETLCFYSLGNFVSQQRMKERVLGGLMFVTFVKDESKAPDAQFYIYNSGMIPVVCHFEQGLLNTRAYPLYLYTEELLEKHIIRRTDSAMNFDFFFSILNELETEIIMHNPF